MRPLIGKVDSAGESGKGEENRKKEEEEEDGEGKKC